MRCTSDERSRDDSREGNKTKIKDAKNAQKGVDDTGDIDESWRWWWLSDKDGFSKKKFASHDAIIFIFPVLILTGARRTRDRRDASRSPLSRFNVQRSNFKHVQDFSDAY